MALQETLSNLCQLAAMSRALCQGVRKAQRELSFEKIELPVNITRSLIRLEMDLDEIALDLDQLSK